MMINNESEYKKRFYRNLVKGSGLCSFKVVVKETDLFVHAKKNLSDLTKELIIKYRGYIEAYICRQPVFAQTLIPWPEKGPVPAIIQDMILASQKAGVGPMAAVAGAIAEYVGQGLLENSDQNADQLIVENGGDLFIKISHPITVGIYAGKSPLSMRLGIKFQPNKNPLGVCTSSGRIGHSMSMGKSDAVCVVSNSCCLADAAATAIGNLVQSEKDIQQAIGFGKKIDGVTGIIIIIGKEMGLWGSLDVVPLIK